MRPWGGVHDYSYVMDSETSHLRDVVYELLTETYPGSLVRAEFRLCGKLLPEPREVSRELLHELPSIDESQELSVQMTKTLRPDQRAALSFVVGSEATPKTQRCTYRAFVQADTELEVGWPVRFSADIPMSSLRAGAKALLMKLSKTQLEEVLSEAGIVTGISDREKGARALVTVDWLLGNLSLRLILKKWCLEPTSSGRLSLGAHVQLLRADLCHDISIGDVGILTHFDSTTSRVEVRFPQCFNWKGQVTDVAVTTKALLPRAEVRIIVDYRVCGSICAQKMGWGKTPLMAALIKHDCLRAAAEQRRSTTLVVVPPKVFRQWVHELKDWLGASGETWMKTPEGIVIWAPVDMAAFKAKDAATAAAAEVVLLPHSLFSSKLYPVEAWPEGLFNVQSQRWNRLILDEAHELSSLSDKVQERLLAVQCDAVHGLSGTPQQGAGSRGAASLALLFKASLCPRNPCRLFRSDDFLFDEDEHVTQAAAAFFQTFARTQASPFSLPVTEHLLSVQLSEAEKVLYANLRDHHAPTPRELLELCCCFVSGAGTSANKEIGVLIKRKKRELEARLLVAKGHAAFVTLLARCLADEHRLASRRQSLKCPTDKLKACWEEGRRLIDGLTETLSVLSSKELIALVKDEHVPGINLSDGLRQQLAAGEMQPYRRAALKEIFSEQLYQLARDFVALGALKRPLDFLERSMTELTGSGGCCPICLDGLENGESTCMTSCGHHFHEECINDVRKTRPECPNCRQRITELYITKPRAPVDPWQKYGTKVKVIIQRLKDIMRDFPGERLLLFVQYRNFRQRLAQAFQEFKVPFLTLAGSARTQGTAITRWQSGNDPGDFVMMLSCEEHNSGITLTRARSLKKIK